eukprot:TRINITY_DN7645_c0_g1_i3.p1 TRINITY_DN7645_c0_g1~~TRINITY_DN7645_c0_g1_i3.p1  ORF type:complete len:388 (-),score=67.49 TRINITY_DN7645_c0_g1_i3:707-1870(-)
MDDTGVMDSPHRVYPGLAASYTRNVTVPVPPGAAISTTRAHANWRLTAEGTIGLLTTPSDLLRWVANYGNNTLGGGQALIDALEAPVVLPSFVQPETVVAYSGGQVHYLLPPFGYPYAQVTSVDGGIPAVYQWGNWAGFRSMLMRVPARGLAVALQSNGWFDVQDPVLFRLATAALRVADPGGLVEVTDVDNEDGPSESGGADDDVELGATSDPYDGDGTTDDLDASSAAVGDLDASSAAGGDLEASPVVDDGSIGRGTPTTGAEFSPTTPDGVTLPRSALEAVAGVWTLPDRLRGLGTVASFELQVECDGDGPDTPPPAAVPTANTTAGVPPGGRAGCLPTLAPTSAPCSPPCRVTPLLGPSTACPAHSPLRCCPPPRPTRPPRRW